MKYRKRKYQFAKGFHVVLAEWLAVVRLFEAPVQVQCHCKLLLIIHNYNYPLDATSEIMLMNKQ